MGRMLKMCERASRSSLRLALPLAVALAGCGERTLVVGKYDPSAAPAAFSPDPAFGTAGQLVLDQGGIDNVAWAPQGFDVQPDGRIVVGGTGGTAQNQDFVAVRLLEDGTLDPSFGQGGIATVDLGTAVDKLETLRVQADGKIVLAGLSDGPAANADWQASVARLLADGTLDPSFAGVGWRHLDLLAGWDLINGQVTLSDGRLRFCGQGWPQVSGQSDFAVYGLTSDGAIDTAFGTGGVLTIDFFADDEFGTCDAGGDDRILVIGTSYHGSAEQFDAAVARVRGGDGTFDPSFSDGTSGLPGRAAIDFDGRVDSCDAIAIQADGKILCAGSTNVVASDGSTTRRDGAVARLNPDGTLDTSFGALGKVIVDLGGDGGFSAVLILPDGRILCGGYGTSSRGDQDFALVVLGADGTPDASVGSNGVLLLDVTSGRNDGIHSMKVDGQGRLLLCGATSVGTGNNDIVVMRLFL